MFQKNQKIKWIGSAIIVLAIILFVAFNVRISSVKQYHDNIENKDISIVGVSEKFNDKNVGPQNNNQQNKNDKNTQQTQKSETPTRNEKDGTQELRTENLGDKSLENAEIGGASRNEVASGGTTVGTAGADTSGSGVSGNGASGSGIGNDIGNGATGNGTGNGASGNGAGNGVSGNGTSETATTGNNESTQQPPVNGEQIICSIEILCDKATSVKNEISNPGIREVIPDNGLVLSNQQYKISAGANVYDLLQYACATNGIPIISNADRTYISSINYLSEKLPGYAGSGWMYSVNGTTPSMPAKKYELKQGDHVVWFYTLTPYI